MHDPVTYFITWTTYGTWLPGDARGWRKTHTGPQLSRPRLEDWCRSRMIEMPILLSGDQRRRVEAVCREHAAIRGWVLHAVSIRSNHVHIVVTADKPPELVRDQFKANATRVLREAPSTINQEKVWSRGGDIEIVDGESNFECVVQYVTEAQDRKDRDP